MMQRLNTNAMTWTALLSKWVEFAQAALALPRDAEGERWRRSVSAIINLQAVTLAVSELEQLPAPERAYARDKTELIIDKSIAELGRIWKNAAWPEMIRQVRADATDALDRAEWCMLAELIWRGEKPVLVPEFDVDDLLSKIDQPGCGTFAIAQPGTYIMPGEPIAWWCDIDNADTEMQRLFPGAEMARAKRPRQIFRQIESSGRILRDIITWCDSPAESGFPLLLPLLQSGQRIGAFTLDAREWEDAQRDQIERFGLDIVDLTAMEDNESAADE